MTSKQALKEAKRRWGQNAMIEQRKMPTIHKDHVLTGPFRVGKVEMGLFFLVKGDGSSWEHAFAMSTWQS